MGNRCGSQCKNLERQNAQLREMMEQFSATAAKTAAENQQRIDQLLDAKQKLTEELARVHQQLIQDREYFMGIIKELREQNLRLEARVNELIKKLEQQRVEHIEELKKRDEMWENRFQVLLEEMRKQRAKRDLSEQLVSMVREQRHRLDTRGQLTMDTTSADTRFAPSAMMIPPPMQALIA